MNLSQLRTQVRYFLNEDTEGFWKDAQLNAYLEMANKKVTSIIINARQEYFVVSSTFQMTAGVQSYKFPADCATIRRMELYDPNDEAFIVKIDELRFPRIEANGDWLFPSPGMPKRYTIFGKQFNVFPKPDGNFSCRIYYDQVQPVLSNDGETPSAPAEFHDLLVFYACLLAKKQNEEDDGGFAALFRDRKNELIEYITRRGGDDPNTVEAYLEGVI